MAKAKTTSQLNRKTNRAVVAGKTVALNNTTSAVTDADIALRAYSIYVAEGYPEGRHLEHWQRAESELRG